MILKARPFSATALALAALLGRTRSAPITGSILRAAALLAGLGLMLAGCDALGFENWSWNQRLVLEVETPQSVVRGGSVVRIEVGSSPKWAPGQGAGGMSGRVAKGEASFVEVAPGEYLFALLDNGTEQLPFYTFFPPDDKDRPRQATELEAMRATGVVPRERYPLLVTFADINDPTTVRKVDPDDLAATFGPGVSLRRITLEITDEPVTEGEVEKVLGWWCELRKERARLNGQTGAISDNELSNNLGTGAFRVGDCT